MRRSAAYLDLPSSSSQGSSEGEEDDEDDDEDGSSGEMEMIRVRALGGSDDEEEGVGGGENDGEVDVESKPGMGWGKHKHVFYQQDEDEVSSSSGERLEEEEARRIQAKRIQQMSEADFLEIPGRQKDDSSSKKKKKTAKAATNEEDLLAVERSVGDNAELDALLRDVKGKVEEVKQTLQPLLSWLESSKLAAEAAVEDEATSSGIAFVEMRYQLLLSYCMNLLFYTLLKTQKMPVKDHPVVEQLVRLRLMLDKTRGIEEKLQPQIKRLLKTAALGVEAVENDAQNARANARAMLEGDEDDQDNDVNAQDWEAAAEAYVAPKRSVAFLDEDDRHAEKKERKAERDKRRAQRSGIMAMVQEEFGEGPEVRQTQLQVLEGDDEEEDAEREQYERDNFIRLGKAKKKSTNVKFVDDLKSLDDFGDVARVMRQEDSKGGHNALASMMSKQLRKRQAGNGDGDDDGDDDDDLNVDGDDDDEDTSRRGRDAEAEEAYDRFVAESKAKKSAKKSNKYESNPNAYRTNVVQLPEGEGGAAAGDGKRGITYQIEANRGIKRGSKKEVARVRNKGKFKKAMLKRGTMVPSGRSESARYSGEKSGINTKVVRSTKLK